MPHASNKKPFLMTWLLGASRGGPGEPAQRCRRKQGQESGGDDVALSPPRVPSGPGGALDGWATRESPRGDRERRVDARGRHEHTRRAARVDATRDARTSERLVSLTEIDAWLEWHTSSFWYKWGPEARHTCRTCRRSLQSNSSPPVQSIASRLSPLLSRLSACLGRAAACA